MRSWARWLLTVALVAGASVSAQGNVAQELDLSVDAAPEDLSDGPPVAALPPVRPGGRVDLEAYGLLHGALGARLGARLVAASVTSQAVEAERLGLKLTSVEARRRMAVVLRVTALVTFELAAGKAMARLHADADAAPAAEVSLPLGRGKRVTPDLARALVQALLAQGASVLRAPVVEVPPPAPLAAEESPEETERVASLRKAAVAPRFAVPSAPPRAMLVLGVGPGFRSLQAVSASPLVPQSPGSMAALSLAAIVFPLRWVPSLAGGPWAGLWLEAAYRRNLVRAVVESSGATSPCAAEDDEFVGRAGYRYALGPILPRVGLGAGVAWQRTAFACALPTLDTAYGATELHLSVQQPVLGEALTAELSGGPRLLFSTRAAGRPSYAFSVELWLTGRLSYFVARLGARFTGTRLSTWPEGVALFDARTFVGVELGAAL